MLRLVPLALIVASFGVVQAQHEAPPPDTLVAADYDAFTFVAPRSDAAARRAAATAQFEFDLTGFPPEAEEAFRFAASIWATHLESPVPIRVRATFAELDPQTLGTAGPACVEARPEFPLDDTWYPVALAEALLGTNLNPPGASVCPGVDITATFNNTLDVDSDGVTDWYYGTDGNTPEGKYDFATVVLHELGHGLGFVGSFEVATEEEGASCPESLGDIPTGFGCWGLGGGSNPLLPFIFDRFAEDRQGVPLLDTSVYPNPSLALGIILQSESVLFDGPTAVTSNGAVPIDLYAPSNFEPGSSFSHLDESVSPPGDPNSLMTPQLARAEAIFSPGPFTCAIMGDIGWTLGVGCRALLEGGLASFIARAADDDVVLIFRLGVESGFTEAVVEQQGRSAFAPAAAVVPTDPTNADAYEVRLGRLAPGSYVFRLRLRRANGSVLVSQELRVGVPPDRRLAIFPNPFVDAASVVIDLRDLSGDDAETIRVSVYDVLGRRVADLLDGTPRVTTGVVELPLDGRGLASGVYFVRVVGDTFEATQTVTRVR
jgi:hypothetical protein